MKVIKVRVTPNARHDYITIEGDVVKAYVTAPASEGKANRALVALLSDFFGVKKRDVTIIKGERSRDKVVEIAAESKYLSGRI
ncbi:MAG: DUF167 domain-containing protein [candidate division WOR-3 bacterium]